MSMTLYERHLTETIMNGLNEKINKIFEDELDHIKFTNHISRDYFDMNHSLAQKFISFIETHFGDCGKDDMEYYIEHPEDVFSQMEDSIENDEDYSKFYQAYDYFTNMPPFGRKSAEINIKRIISDYFSFRINEKKPLHEMASAKNPDDVFTKIYKDAVKEHKSKNEKGFEINFYDLWYNKLEDKAGSELWNDADEFIKYVNRKKLYKTINVPGYTMTVSRQGSVSVGSVWNYTLLDFAILYLASPCKEFEKLNKLLEKYGCKKINNDFLYCQYVTGKRNDIFHTARTRYLCHMPDKCNEIIEWVKQNMTASRVLTIDTQVKIDRGEDEYLYRNESEWDGIQYGQVDLEITRNGKTITKRSFNGRW